MVSKKALSFDEKRKSQKKEENKKEVIKVPKHFYKRLTDMVKS
jgi:DNA replication initiation complex subunit (GINS family)